MYLLFLFFFSFFLANTLIEHEQISVLFQVYNNIDAFPVMYNAVGLGWIWSFLKLPGMYNLSQKAYSWYVCIIK